MRCDSGRFLQRSRGSGCAPLGAPTPDVRSGRRSRGRPPPQVTCRSLAFPTGPPRGSSSPTATSWTLVPRRVPGSSDPGSPPLPLRRLRRPGRIRRLPPVARVPSPLVELLVLPLAPLPGLSWNVHSRSARFPRRVTTPRAVAPLRSRGCRLPTRSVLVVSTTSTACSVPGLQRVSAGTGSGVRQVGPSSFVGARPTSRSTVHLGPCAGCPCAPHPSKVSSSPAAGPHHCVLLPSCRSSPRRCALAQGFGFLPHGPRSVGGAFRSVSVVTGVSAGASGWARGFASGMSPSPRSVRLPGRSRSETVGAGRFRPIGLPSRACSSRTCGPPLRFPSRGRVAARIASSRLLEVGLSCSLSPLAGDGWPESPRRSDRSALRTTSVLWARSSRFASEGRSTRSSMALGVAGGPVVPLPRPSLPHRP